jgi:hypothetical protein
VPGCDEHPPTHLLLALLEQAGHVARYPRNVRRMGSIGRRSRLERTCSSVR